LWLIKFKKKTEKFTINTNSNNYKIKQEINNSNNKKNWKICMASELPDRWNQNMTKLIIKFKNFKILKINHKVKNQIAKNIISQKEINIIKFKSIKKNCLIIKMLNKQNTQRKTIKILKLANKWHKVVVVVNNNNKTI